MHWAPAAGALVALLISGGAAARAQEPAVAAPAAAPLAVAAAAPGQAVVPDAPATPALRAAVRERFAPVAPAPAAQRGQSRLRNYVHDLVGPGALLGMFAGAAVDQMDNTPRQWGGGFSGYGDRVASSAGQLFVGETVHHGLAAAMDHTTQYERCGCTAFSAQVSHAFVGAFTDRDASGRQEFSVPRVAGAFAGSFATLLWWPGRTVGGAAVGGGLSLLGTAAGNLLTELLHSPRYRGTTAQSGR